jgi:hypothetical protein
VVAYNIGVWQVRKAFYVEESTDNFSDRYVQSVSALLKFSLFDLILASPPVKQGAAVGITAIWHIHCLTSKFFFTDHAGRFWKPAHQTTA